MKIPKKIKVGNAFEVKIIQEDISPKLGYIDTEKNEIHIHKDQHEIGKAVILVHELIHLCDEMNKNAGVYKHGLREIQVENISGMLTALLLQNGLMGNYKPKEVLEYILSVHK